MPELTVSSRDSTGGLGCLRDDVDELLAGQGNVDLGGEAGHAVVVDGRPVVRPALDPEGPVTLGVGAHPALPDVEALGLELLHAEGELAPVGGAEHGGRVDTIVTFAEDIRGDREPRPNPGIG